MNYLSISFYIMTSACVIIYYILPLRIRWISLLACSLFFYYLVSDHVEQLLLFLLPVLISYGTAILLKRVQAGRRHQRIAILCSGILVTILPLAAEKVAGLLPDGMAAGLYINSWSRSIVMPVGVAFYTLQIIAYLADVWNGKTEPQTNLFQYTLFITFFPQIMQGPIPRYNDLNDQLIRGHRFSWLNIRTGFIRIAWGFFLKYMIADKAAVYVNAVFEHDRMYGGCYIWLAGVLYSIQLYTDFMACTTISRGVAALFGIQLGKNFHHPYFAESIRDFWRRWHISLSTWLRDYIYIPLGGSRKGTKRKYFNILATFLISGLWHGEGLHYVVWGLMHGVYQIAGAVTLPFRDKVYSSLRIERYSFTRKLYKTVGTFFWVMLAWIMFRAQDVREGVHMIRSMFTVYNPWILTNGTLEQFMDARQWFILVLSVILFFLVSLRQRTTDIEAWVEKQHVSFRWILYLLLTGTTLIFGTYGFGYQAGDFIYAGF